MLRPVRHRPRLAVKAFDRAAHRHRGMILDHQRGEDRACRELSEGLDGMEQSVRVLARQRDDAAVARRERGDRIAFGMRVADGTGAGKRVADDRGVAGAEQDVRAIGGGGQPPCGRDRRDSGGAQDLADQRDAVTVGAGGGDEHHRSAERYRAGPQRDRRRRGEDGGHRHRLRGTLRGDRGRQAHRDQGRVRPRHGHASRHNSSPVFHWYYESGLGTGRRHGKAWLPWRGLWSGWGD
jgi:hypothetical protein